MTKELQDFLIKVEDEGLDYALMEYYTPGTLPKLDKDIEKYLDARQTIMKAIESLLGDY